jgi:hypothetical protein
VLKPEIAAKRLEPWKIAAPEAQFVAELASLPPELREIGNFLLHRGPEGTGRRAESWEETRAWEVKMATALDALPAPDRLQLLRIFFPHLAEHVEAGWHLLRQFPFQSGYAVRPFRAPRLPAESLDRRVQWLQSLVGTACYFRGDVMTAAWLAAWAPYLREHRGDPVDEGRLLAAIIEQGGPTADEVFDILCQSARNEHEIGGMGRHVTSALLMASRPEGWALIEKMLLAAQRQEGLRQTILETVHETHPQAFRRMLGVIVDNNLVRFSAVTRALNGWTGLEWDALAPKSASAALAKLAALLESDTACEAALGGTDPQSAFLALWTIAFDDVQMSVPAASRLLEHRQVEMRYVAVRHLVRTGVNDASKSLLRALSDDDLRVALTALEGNPQADDSAANEQPDHHALVFEAVERLMLRLPERPVQLAPLVWPGTGRKAERGEVAERLTWYLGSLPPTRLISHLPLMRGYVRRRVIDDLAAQKQWDPATRNAFIDFAGDTSADARQAALSALAKAPLEPGESRRLEEYLTRKVADLRRGILVVLLGQSDGDALASAERLMASKDGNQRLAGIELLRQLAEADRQRKACRERVDAYQSARKKLTPEEATQIDAIRESDRRPVSITDGLGLLNPAGRAPVVQPQTRAFALATPAALAALAALDRLVHEHREMPIRIKDYEGERDELLGNVGWRFPSPDCRKPPAEEAARLPLAEVWESWHAQRPAAERDGDELELLRAAVWLAFAGAWDIDEWQTWVRKRADRAPIDQLLGGDRLPLELQYREVVAEILSWLRFLHPPAGAADWFLNGIETSFTLVPPPDMEPLKKPAASNPNRYAMSGSDDDWRNQPGFSLLIDGIDNLTPPGQFPRNPEQKLRLWNLHRWRNEPFSGARRHPWSWEALRDAYRLHSPDGPRRDDMLADLIGPRISDEFEQASFGALSRLSARVVEPDDWQLLQECPEVHEMVCACRERILEIELERGETPTPATQAAWSLVALWGTATLIRILTALGKTPFTVRKETDIGRAATLTQLARITYPLPEETPATFAAAMRAATRAGQFPEERILQLTFLAPQWARFIEGALGWDGYREGMYWFLAHMRYVYGIDERLEETHPGGENTPPSSTDNSESCPRQSTWARLIAERTPLSDEDRQSGAVDVGWFQRTYAQLTPKRWLALAEAAKFAANANQARHAQFIADVLLGKASRRELLAGVRKKRLKDHVRMLGLLPLAEGKKRAADLAERYAVLQEYRRYARTLSSLTKPEALRAIEIGMKNLAATAGFPDPLRLEWEQEARTVRDLAKGSIGARKDGVTVTLALDENAQPQLTIVRAGKPLKSVPPAVKKDKKVTAILERVGELRQQVARMRWSLESAMCRGDTFTGAELAQLAGHALLAPLLGRLVLVGKGLMGYPQRGGKALRNHAGRLKTIKKSDVLRIAHPSDFLESGQWDKWQHECFRAERMQPFKQVFRELYVVTKQEKTDGAASRRYAGQQVNPQQAYALWGQRGWHTQDGVFKTFFDEKMTVSVSFNYGYTTPLAVEGLTFDTIDFYDRDREKAVPAANVPPRIFSEVMRDIDLVVSVAHAGGVDPEASASTVEMRAALLRETAALLGLKNVRLKPPHVLIDGELANYSMHLGSATVHRLPGGAVCLVPVHSQHRGRLFLPFADDDPKTAEVVSKAILLARDHEIQDPTILEQLQQR